MKKSIVCLALLLAPTLCPAAVTVYTAFLSGPAESPPNASPGSGTATVTIDSTENTMRVQVAFAGLVGNVSASHIHAATALPGVGTAGVAVGLTGFPSGVMAGGYDVTFNMLLPTSYNAGYMTANGGTPPAAFAGLQTHMAGMQTYVNIHSNVFSGGEIRGFLVPEASTAGLAAIAGAGLMIRRRRL